jgi:Spy/CpxP family protein refolding chaperone
MTNDFGEVDVKKGSLTMKTKLFFSILVLVSVVPGALAAGTKGETNVHAGSGQLPVTAVEHSASSNVQTDPGVLANDPKQASQDFDSILIAITEKFSGTLAAIADAIKRGELTTDQGREISAQQYQLVQMQFELISLWREMEEQDSAKIPTLQASPDLRQENEAVVVALPFSSLQLNPSMAEYLGLTSSQIDAIQQVIVREQHRLEPLMSQFRITREKFFAIGSDHMSESEIKSLADTEATVLGKLIVANARMQSKIYKILSPDQQKRINELERTQGTGMMRVK